MKRRDLDGKFIGMQASVDESIGPVSPCKPTSPKQSNAEQEAVDEVAESSKQESPQEEPAETKPKKDVAKTKKKKKGLFSKLKTKK